MTPTVSVVMPTHDQESFLPAAMGSLLTQTLTSWELVVVDDGSPRDVAAALGDALRDPRVRLTRLPTNRGLGAALNTGLDLATGALVAYLPSDDVIHRDHLAALVAALDGAPEARLAVTGIRYSPPGGNPDAHTVTAPGRIDGEPLQLVQVMHRRSDERWLERSELTTDDLDTMLWTRLLAGTQPALTGRVTCTWRAHPKQRSRALREPWGGLNTYRARYRVAEPLRLRSSVGSLHDEVAHYRRFRERVLPPSPDGLRILLVGELAHNPERILALAEQGHELHGLWIEDPVWFTTVGPMPFGHVRDVPRDGWRDHVRELRPDVIYALLNWHAVPLAHEVLTADLGIPFVWHVKEGPFHSQGYGHWDRLVELHLLSDGQVYSSRELRDWFGHAVPGTRHGRRLVLDGDLPKAEWLVGERSSLLSDSDGDVHTVIPGRPMGPAPAVVGALARAGVHVHLYGEKVVRQRRDWVDAVRREAPRHFHLHPQVEQAEWVREFSRYDAGWLHDATSANGGDLHVATWDDLNVPARMGTLVAAGVPVIQRDNSGSTVATQTLARDHRLGLFWSEPGDLVAQLRDRDLMRGLRDSAWSQRARFTFDAHVDELVSFFRSVIAGRLPGEAAPAADPPHGSHPAAVPAP